MKQQIVQLINMESHDKEEDDQNNIQVGYLTINSTRKYTFLESFKAIWKYCNNFHEIDKEYWPAFGENVYIL